MNRRDAMRAALMVLGMARASAAAGTVSTLVGSGAAGFSDGQVNDPYGLAIGPDGALYFCDLGNQRIRRFDVRTRRVTTVAGNGERGYAGDGGPARDASLNMPHEIQFDEAGHLYIAERDNHVVRRVDGRNGVITAFAGTGAPGFSGDGGPAARATLRHPHSIVVAPGGGLLICDTGNHRIRRVRGPGDVIETFGGTGDRAPVADGITIGRASLNGPRSICVGRSGDLYLALREGNAIYRIATSGTLHHVAGTGEQGYSGDGGPARQATLAGPKGLAYGGGRLFVADTENHAVRCVDLMEGTIRTVLGTGTRGDGPEPDPLRCALARPHGVLVDAAGALYVGDSEAHRIRRLLP